MNGREFVEAVRDAEATALSRLGSDKYLLAATGADLETGPVLRTVATAAASGRDTFAAWADEEGDPAAARVAAWAETERDHYERVTDHLDGGVDPGGAVHDALGSRTGTAARAGAAVGRGLVLDRTRLQVVNFFVNEADEARADLARDLREDASGQVDDAAALLDEVCESDGDWDAARGAAEALVRAAYDEYVAGCSDLGLDPKPVC